MAHMTNTLRRILLVSDSHGLPALLRHLPQENICGFVAAEIRPTSAEFVRAKAEELEIPFVLQPRFRSETYSSFLQQVSGLAPDGIAMYSYSMILRPDVLAIPSGGTLNLHGGLLPQYRGSNPIQWAILNGETKAGAALHYVVEACDAGPVIAQKAVPLLFEDTWVEVMRRIDGAAEILLAEYLPKFLNGTLIAVPQDESQAVHHRRREPEDGRFTWDQPLIYIYNLIRALVAPHPGGSYLDKNGNEVVIKDYRTIAELALEKAAQLGHPLGESGMYALRPLRSSNGESEDLLLKFTVKCGTKEWNGAFTALDYEARAITCELDDSVDALEEPLLAAVDHFAGTELGLTTICFRSAT